MSLRALLVDGGGTLFPEAVSVLEDAHSRSALALSTVLPELNADQLRILATEFWAMAEDSAHMGVQPTDSFMAQLLERTRSGLGARTAEVRHALARNGSPLRHPLPGAAEMLREAKQLGLATVLISNTAWVCEQDYWFGMREMGLAEHLDGLVSSFDVGVRKPHRRIFEAAVARAGSPPHGCVMVGDSEPNDIAPAADLGMRTIRVAIQNRGLGETRADAVAGSLSEVRDILRGWCPAHR